MSNFPKRLKKIIDHYHLNATSFAEKIKVQRSSISHLLSGRNKPSLDFVLKVLEEFKDVELYWLLNGKGSFPQAQLKTDSAPTLFSEDSQSTATTDVEIDKISTDKDTNDSSSRKTKLKKKISNVPTQKSDIDKVIIFYTNGTFKVYNEL